ncbi:MAG: hypothetical protein HY735_35180 [Verrucomicrobia bacterium]|nr:hypothetical protein [Verrucomicrobiota bacterium]
MSAPVKTAVSVILLIHALFTAAGFARDFHKLVAQIFNLPYRRLVACAGSTSTNTSERSTPCRLQVGVTADCKSALRGLGAALTRKTCEISGLGTAAHSEGDASPPAVSSNKSTNQPAAGAQTTVKAALPAFPLQTNDCVAFIGGTTTVQDAKHGYLETLLTRRYPGHKLRFRNLAWEGDTVFGQERPLNFPGLVQSLKAHHATVIVANFGLMESLQGQEGLSGFVQAYGFLLDELSRITSRIVLVSPFRLERPARTVHAAAEKTKQMEGYVQAIRDLTKARGMLLVDLFRLGARASQSDDMPPLTADGMHPSAYGYWRAAHEAERDLGLPQRDWRVEIDARTRGFQATGTELHGVQISTSTVRFQTLDEMLPGPVFSKPDGNVSVWGARTLTITGLRPGRYVLRIDGVPLHEQSELFWARGRVLTHGPEVRQAERLRGLIVEKNADFFNYWRPQNWAFLHGDLISQPSSHRHDQLGVRWFPGEMEVFPRLIEQKEREIDQLARPSFHVYELNRIE